MSDKYVLNRNGKRCLFDKARIYSAINNAFLSENQNVPDVVTDLTDQVVNLLCLDSAEEIKIEFIQDTVEEVLMSNSYHLIAKNYILYRQEHTLTRQEKVLTQIDDHSLQVRVSPDETVIFDPAYVEESLRQMAEGLYRVSISKILDSVKRSVYNDISQKELSLLILSSVRDNIEIHYEYSYLAARIVLNDLYQIILNQSLNTEVLNDLYKSRFKAFIAKGISEGMLNPQLADFDLDKLAQFLEPKRDQLFMYLGVQIISDRYLLRDRSSEQVIYELPQWFWMRVSMGLALKEENKEQRAVEFYETLSNMDLVSSTPTLFNSGTVFSQMSSCYLNLAEDSLDHIFKLYADNARLSKWAGGIGTDWTYIRATGSKIRGTNGHSQGVIPFIKIFNDVALAVNQGGKRKGAMCAYMENWHLDIEQFIELKKNTGDERRRAHDINTACWISDLFMKRVKEDGKWTLFCPSDVKDLHDLYGKAFEDRYIEYENQDLPRSKTMKASDLWRRMITMLYETGHPWITFKDPCNVRSPQDHVGVIHSSNLCTEITLNTSKDETAVCNLASLNLANMIKDKELDREKLAKTVRNGLRMLDNVIDNNYYPTPEAEKANLKHRAVGLGVMGYQDALYQMQIPFDSDDNVEFADYSMENISYYAILASSELAKERGSYSSFKGSKWDRDILPFDTVNLLEEQRQRPIKVGRECRLDWRPVREHIRNYGMRNSNVMAIAPTATIANIAGVYPCTEPAFKNIYMKENLSGNFLVVNKHLIDSLEKLGIWGPDIIRKIKMYDGSVAQIEEIPEYIRHLYKETFEVSMTRLIDIAARRSKWIDQSASTNVFMDTQSGKEMSDLYFYAWEAGLKTTYYFRTLGASQVTKATIQEDVSVQKPDTYVSACKINDPTCEACE
ncbi:MAG: ribonucleoside-diphosphate reductase subunit alpha [bacterium]